jgi:hypothetical protein
MQVFDDRFQAEPGWNILSLLESGQQNCSSILTLLGSGHQNCSSILTAWKWASKLQFHPDYLEVGIKTAVPS